MFLYHKFVVFLIFTTCQNLNSDIINEDIFCLIRLQMLFSFVPFLRIASNITCLFSFAKYIMIFFEKHVPIKDYGLIATMFPGDFVSQIKKHYVPHSTMYINKYLNIMQYDHMAILFKGLSF